MSVLDVLPSTRTRARYFDLWKPRIGIAATQLGWRALVRLFYGYLLGTVGIAAVVAGGLASNLTLGLVGAAIGLVGVATIFAGAAVMTRSNVAAADALGNPGGRKAVSVPASTAAYERFCERHGVAPYQAR